MQNLIVWADIPVTDLDRAMAFYGAVLQRPFIKVEGMEGIALPGPDEDAPAGEAAEQEMPVAFDLFVGEQAKPSEDGSTVYLESNGDAQGMLQRAADAGGEILMPATFMGDMVGTMGFFQGQRGQPRRCAPERSGELTGRCRRSAATARALSPSRRAGGGRVRRAAGRGPRAGPARRRPRAPRAPGRRRAPPARRARARRPPRSRA